MLLRVQALWVLFVIAAAGALSSRARAQDLLINEFLAANESGLLDEDGDSSDWVEVFNTGGAAVDLAGWSLSDNPLELRKWGFPALTLGPGEYVVVFASGKDRAAAGSELHASFKLSGDSEFLALVRPDGSIEHAYAPSYPPQHEDVSYGLVTEVRELLTPTGPAEVFVPRDGALARTWTEAGFAPDASWRAGTNGVGYEAETGQARFPPPVGYWGFDGTTDDSTGNNPGSFEGGDAPAFTEGFDGASGGALSLDGANDYIDVVQNVGLPIFSRPAYTVALWVRGSRQNDKRVFAEGSLSSTNPLFTIGTDATGTTGAVDIFIRTESGSTVLNHVKSSRVAFDGTWHHIAWVDQGGNAALYIDGVRDAQNFSYTKPALPLNLTAFGAVLRTSACCFFNGAIDDAALWDVALSAAEVADLAAGVPPLDARAYDALITTDVESAMRGVNASAYVRLPFTVADLAALATLTLRMRYNDGFVAYLNGTEVARRNAPAAVSWNSTATAERTARESVTPEEVNLSSHLGALRPGLNVLAVHGLNVAAGDGDFLVVAELLATTASGRAERFFVTPSPGAANLGGVVDFVADTKFSADRGFYDAPFEVEITTETPGAAIRYTTDFTWPSASHGQVYTGPIAISGFTVLRAIALKEGFQPTNVDTQTYVFLEGVIRQPPDPAGFPSEWQTGWAADYAMDPEICINTASPYYEPTIREDLKAIPTLSVTLDNDDLFGPTRGIYNHSENGGLAWERRASAELILPDGGEGFQVNCGLRMQGGASRDNVRQVKHSFRLLFKRLYGPGKLNYDWFADSPVDRFDTITLRAFFTDGWSTRTVEPRYRPDDSQYIRDVWMKDSQLDMSQPGGRNSYVHLYINGLYWGLYNPTERPDASMNAEHQGGEREEWDVYKDFGEVQDGNDLAWRQMMSLANAGLGSDAAYQRIQGRNADGTPNESFPVLLDVENLIDYMVLHIYAGAEDWPHHNWYAARRRVGLTPGFRFYSWDQEIVLDDLNRNRINVSDDNTPARLYSALRANAEFRVWFGDRVHRHLFNGGTLTTAANIARWMRRAREIDRAVVGESARWGDRRREPPFTRDVEWIAEQNVLVNEYFPQVHGISLNRFRAGALYPQVEAPAFNQHGGLVDASFRLEVTAPAGTVYFTLDGSDPRLPGGAVSPSAQVAGQAFAAALVPSEAPVRALVPAGGSLGLDWTLPDFDDGAWIAGTTGVGFERTTGYEDLLGTDLLAAMDGVNTTVYTRVPFDVADPGSIESLTLRMKFDDGFIAHLNGAQVAARNAPSSPSWDSAATQPQSDASAVVFEDFDVTAFRSQLRAGRNVLAIHGLNSSLTSGDMLILPELVSAVPGGAGIPLGGPTTVKARAFNGAWSALNEAFFYFDVPLRITEIMYHPPEPAPGDPYEADDYEFIEIQNVGDEDVDLRGIRVTGAVDFDFAVQSWPPLRPGEMVLLVENLLAFVGRYGTQGMFIAGEYSGGLSNSTERLVVLGPSGEPIHDFAYDDAWHPLTDGGGHSLVIVDPSAPPGTWGDAASWRPSRAPGGSPGVDESAATPAGGRQLVGNLNQDRTVDISDPVRMLLFLFAGAAITLPCEGELEPGSGNRVLLDVNGDRGIDLSDPVYLLNFLFAGGPPPALGTGCVRMVGCPDACGR